jgi:hypothetical protein
MHLSVMLPSIHTGWTLSMLRSVREDCRRLGVVRLGKSLVGGFGIGT